MGAGKRHETPGSETKDSAIADQHSFYFLFLNLFIYLFIYILAALGLRCCVQAFSSCGKQGLLFIVVRGLLIAVASLVPEHGL